MSTYIKNSLFTTYSNDTRDLVNAFYPGTVYTQDETGADFVVDIDSLKGAFVGQPERFDDKTEYKRALYRMLSGLSGRELPWGTLTGIRPVRIIELLKARGLDREQINAQLRDRFLISGKKRELLWSIADKERRLMDGIDYRNGISLYVGIPFCPTRCLYCSFTSNPVGEWQDRTDLYLDCLLRELKLLSEGELSDREGFDWSAVKTVYVGGGTPTALTAKQLDRLLEAVSESLEAAGNRAVEFTVEAGRPDSITVDKLRVLKAWGVSRISVNPQTFNQRTLDLIGRRHTVGETVQAYELARRLGFDNINMDLIMGLPGEDINDVRYSLDRISELAPDSLTVHTLAVKRASRLNIEGKAWGGVERKGSRSDASEAEEIAGMTQLGAECAARLGMEPYYIYRQKNMAGNQENVGYARPGKECLYNILMMEEKHSVYGVGAGASTKLVTRKRRESGETEQITVKRTETVKNIADYMIYTGEKIR
ncbi:MAG: coproporphyrinogen dehydrogenase HemZ [Eubacteriales bacterium]|nr:coproporphyrinogen dehydrogenase HemZ [Eubacteriales bacterium]